MVELRRSLDDYERQNSTESPSPVLCRPRSKLKRRIESRVFYVLISLRAALQRRLCARCVQGDRKKAKSQSLERVRLSRKMVNNVLFPHGVQQFGHVYIPDERAVRAACDAWQNAHTRTHVRKQ